jgi:hypothetical protein
VGNAQSRATIRRGLLGEYVSKQIAPTTNVLNPLFTIAGGLIALTSLTAEVNVAIPNTASLTIKLQATPSGGAAADLCGATTITNDALGSLYSLTSGVLTDLLSVQSVSSIGGTPVAASEVPTVTYTHLLWRPIVLRAGSIGVLVSNHTITPGAMKWHLTYVPIEPLAAVTAV